MDFGHYKHGFMFAQTFEEQSIHTFLVELAIDQNISSVFLAPKTYAYTTEEKDVLKHKGAAKHFVDKDWFENQYARRKNKKGVPYSTPFGVD